MSPEQLAEIKACGYQVETPDEAVEALKTHAAQLCGKIEHAFAGVTLGNGIGLSEANAMDDWKDAAARAKCRLTDEKDDWRRIGSDELNRYVSSPLFFDAEGMRFHLPALLISDLLDEYHFGMVFKLTHSPERSREQFRLLDGAQREVVREYLNFLLIHPDYEDDRSEIADGLLGYWADGAG
jgi:hypothetical protein